MLLTGYQSDPEFSPHTMIREAAQQLLARAHAEGSVGPNVTVDDVLQLANGISLAVESLPDPAQRADVLVALVMRRSPGGLVEQNPLGHGLSWRCAQRCERELGEVRTPDERQATPQQ